MKRTTIAIVLITFSGLLMSCATHPTDPQDPYEPFNRNVYKLNNCIDHTVYRPIAQIYSHLLPPFARKGVTNFFKNMDEPMIFTNDILQGKMRYAGIDVARFVINTTIGIVGLFDVASKIGLPKHTNAFGNTFAYYSDNKKSPYLVIPFLGPSTFRDAFAIPFNIVTNPILYFKRSGITYGLTALYYVNLRSRLLPLDKLIDTAFDPYAAIRDAYLTHRNNDIEIILTQGDYIPGQSKEHRGLDEFIKHGASTSSEDQEAVQEFTFGDEPTSEKQTSN